MSAAIYYYPIEGGNLEVIDLGESLTDLHVHEESTAVDAMAGSGGVYRHAEGGRLRIRVLLTLFTDRDLWRKLRTLQRHLDLGYACSVTADTTKTYLHRVLTDDLNQGDTSFDLSGNVCTPYASVSGPSATDEVTISAFPPVLRREWTTVNTYSATTLTLDDGLRYEYSPLDEITIVRHDDFYPFMRMPPGVVGRPIVTSDHRNNFSLDLTLVEDLAGLYALAEAAGTVTLGDASDDIPLSPGDTLDSIAGTPKVDPASRFGSRGISRLGGG